MLDAYERRVADAEAMVVARAAARRGPRRVPVPADMSHLVRPPADPGEMAYMVGTAERPVSMTRAMVRRVLRLAVPHGLAYMQYHLDALGLQPTTFLSVCRRLGLSHLLLDVPIREVLAELEARRARGAPPTARELPLMMVEGEREYADAMLDVYARKAAEAEARVAMEAAPRAA